MRLIFQGNGRLTIDVLGPYWEPTRQSGGKSGQVGGGTAEAAHPWLDLPLEEALFAGAAHLLRQHYARTRTTPGRRVIAAARQVFEVLLERGDLPSVGPADIAFLAKLLAVLEQITDDAGRPFFAGLIAFVRELILGDDDSESAPDDSNGHSGGNGHSGRTEEPSDGDDEPPTGKSGGNNGTPGNGSPL